jgi:hypothetical protein
MKQLFLLLMSFISLAACQSAGDGKSEAGTTIDSVQQALDDATLTAEDRGPSVALEVPVMLLYRMKVGDRFGYRFVNTEDVKLVQDTIENINHQVVSWWYRFEVIEAAAGGGVRLRATCDRVLFEGRYRDPSGSRSMRYDSDADNAYDLVKQYAQYNAPVGVPFVLTVEKDGRISDVAELTEVIKNYLKDDFRTTKSNQIEAITRDYADVGIKAVLQLAFQKLADVPVGKDSVWMLSSPDRLGYLAMRNAARYTVRDIVQSPLGKVAQIDVRLTKTYTGEKKVDTGQGMATMSEFDAQGQGSTVFNIDRGRLQRRRLRTTVNVKMWVEIPEELKELTRGTPQEMSDFWWTLDGSTENVIEPYEREE